MRDKFEKKPITKSVRLTIEEAQVIQKRAEAFGLKESDYIRHKLTDTDNAMTPKERVSLQNVMNAAYTALIKAGASEREIREFERECGKMSGNPLIQFVVSYDSNVINTIIASSITEKIARFLADSYQYIWVVHYEPIVE